MSVLNPVGPVGFRGYPWVISVGIRGSFPWVSVGHFRGYPWVIPVGIRGSFPWVDFHATKQ